MVDMELVEQRLIGMPGVIKTFYALSGFTNQLNIFSLTIVKDTLEQIAYNGIWSSSTNSAGPFTLQMKVDSQFYGLLDNGDFWNLTVSDFTTEL
jgi:hypothetical protein